MLCINTLRWFRFPALQCFHLTHLPLHLQLIMKWKERARFVSAEPKSRLLFGAEKRWAQETGRVNRQWASLSEERKLSDAHCSSASWSTNGSRGDKIQAQVQTPPENEVELIHLKDSRSDKTPARSETWLLLPNTIKLAHFVFALARLPGFW